jgi:hypothetical protein
MAVIGIITLGTRDLQFSDSILKSNDFIIAEEGNGKFHLQHHSDSEVLTLVKDPNLSGVLIPLFPRLAGAWVSGLYDVLVEWMRFPILHKAFEYFKTHHFPDEIWWVYTDQHRDPSNPKHWQRDTVGYSELANIYVSKYCQHQQLTCPEFYKIPFTERLTDMEFAYIHTGQFLFGNKNFDKTSLLNPQNTIYLLNQGGIDAINTAILLKLTEYRPDLVLLQVREDNLPCRVSSFPSLLFNNYQNRNVLLAAQDYRFDWILNSSQDPAVLFAARTAVKLINYEWGYFLNAINHESKALLGINGMTELIDTLKHSVWSENKEVNQIYAIQWYYRQGLFSEVLWRLFTFSEVLIRKALNSIGSRYDGYNPNVLDADTIQFLWLRDKAFAQEYAFKYKDKLTGVSAKFASVDQILFVLEYFSKENPSQTKTIKFSLKIAKAVEKIKTNRNRLIHQGQASDFSKLNEKLTKAGIKSIESLLEILMKHYGLTGMGFLDIIRDFILQKVKPDL